MKQLISTIILVFGFGFSAFAQNAISNCAAIKVTGGGVVEAGAPMTFTANVTGKTKSLSLEYEWKVSAGEIASGQRTASITIDTTGLSNVNITAEVQVKGLYENCPNTASEIGSVASKPIGCPFDDFGRLSKYDVYARIQNLYVALDGYTGAQGYIINYGTEKEIIDRKIQIKKAIEFLNLDANRVTMIRAGDRERGIRSIVWIAPPGAEPPTPDME